MAESLGHLLQEHTGGRPFVFVVMAFRKEWPYYKAVRKLIEEETNLKCIRADDLGTSGHDLLEKVHLLIDRAELVMAELSTKSENVFYEVGYATGKNKPLLLLAPEDQSIPIDLRGRELITYQQPSHNSETLPEKFERRFRQQIRLRLASRLILLRDMLLADSPVPSYIVASPRYPSDRSKIPGERYHRRTFGDNLGIRGLMEAFGAMLGEGSGVEIVSGQYSHPSLEPKEASLYLIGSKKVNPVTGKVLDKIQKSYRGREWYLGRIPRDPKTNDYLLEAPRDPEEQGDYNCRLYEIEGDNCTKWQGKTVPASDVEGVVHRTDYGIVIRSPHPDHPPESGRLVVVMAGAHSLGTGAACLAATRSSKIHEIREKLKEHRTHNFEDKSRAFWALVKGSISEDGSLDETGVEIERAGWF